MVKLRSILAENMRAHRNRMGLSQLKLADMVDTASNYIAMIEAEKRFPTDTMLEKIAGAFQIEPYELFAITPVQREWRETILNELGDFISRKLTETQNKNDTGRIKKARTKI